MSYPNNALVLSCDELMSNKEPCPQLIVLAKDKKLGLVGYTVIDSIGANGCSGGIRMTHDVSLNEVSSLARTMTLKFAYMNSYIGGAKSGIICPLGATDAEKTERLMAFGRSMSPVMKKIYAPGGDIGVGAKERDIISKAAGLPIRETPAKHKSGFLTAFGVYTTIKIALAKMGADIPSSRFALEGYGSVGRALAKFLHNAGGKVIAVSTFEGALYNSNGLNIDELDELANKLGDKVVLTYPNAEKIDKSEIFALDANVLVPGARPWSINEHNVHNIKAKLIVPAANIPVTKRASEILYKNDVMYVPDFVANGVGIKCGGLINNGFDENDVLDVISRVHAEKVTALMDLAKEHNLSQEDAAVKIAHANLEKLKREYVEKNNKLWIINKLKEEKSIKSFLGKVASVIHKKHPYMRNFTKSTALENIYRQGIREIEDYSAIDWEDKERL